MRNFCWEIIFIPSSWERIASLKKPLGRKANERLVTLVTVFKVRHICQIVAPFFNMCIELLPLFFLVSFDFSFRRFSAEISNFKLVFISQGNRQRCVTLVLRAGITILTSRLLNCLKPQKIRKLDGGWAVKPTALHPRINN